ncbi:MAG: TolC family protein [Rubricoccaceae bacterium]
MSLCSPRLAGPAGARRVAVALAAGLLLPATGLLLLAAAATAQPVPERGLRLQTVPPLPDSLRLYGETFATGLEPAPLLAPAQPVSLADAVAIALARNPERAASALEALRAETDVTPGNAGFLPTLDASVRVSGGQGGQLFGGQRASAQGSTTVSADLAAGVTLFDGGRRAATFARLEADARRFALLADLDAEALVLAVVTAYYDAARQAALVDALAEAVGVSEDRLRLAAAEVRIGTAADVDAALALADLNADRAALLRQQLQLAAARATLGGLLALPDPLAVAPADSLALGPPPDLPRLALLARTQNRRLRALAVAEEAAARVADEVRSEFAPRVRATAGLGAGAADRGPLPLAFRPGLAADLSYGLTLSLPLLDGGERRRRVQVAGIRQRQAALDTAGERLALETELARLAASVQTFRALVALEARNETIARQNVRVGLAQLQLGFISPLELRQVQLALVNVQTRRVDVLFQALRAEAELRFLAGTLLPPEAVLAAP